MSKNPSNPLTTRALKAVKATGPFPKVRAARELFRERAIEILESYLAIIAEARARGDLAIAAEHTQWLMDHMPNEDGTRVIDSSASKPRVVDVSTAPTIQIGIALGGMPKQKELPPVAQDGDILEHE